MQKVKKVVESCKTEEQARMCKRWLKEVYMHSMITKPELEEYARALKKRFDV